MSFYNTVEQNRNIYTLRCIKCGDTFDSKHKFSNRKSCRLHSYVRNNKNQLTNSELLGEKGLYIPIGNHLSKNKQEYIVNSLIKVLDK